jgi:hypothetical protein
MSRKDWIWTTIIIAVIHLILVWLLTPVAGDIIFTRFDGAPYESSLDPLWLGLYFLLYLPYLIIIYSGIAIASNAPGLFAAYLANSILYGLLGAWLISKLPFMRERNQAVVDQENPGEDLVE